MKKLLIFLAFTAQAQAPDTFRDKWLEFLSTWQDVIRVSYGCPLTVTRLDDAQCNPGEAAIDIKLFTKAQKQAQGIFGIEKR